MTRKGTRTVTVRLSVDIDVDVEVSTDNETEVVAAQIVGGDVDQKIKRMNPPLDFVQVSCLDPCIINELACEAALCAEYDDAELIEADIKEGLEADK